jgi:hypothetical protein
LKYRVAASVFVLVGVLAYAQDIAEANLPDAPQPQPMMTPAPQTMGKAQNRVRVWNKKFTLAHAAYFGAIVYDVEMTHQGLAHHKCVEKNGGNPTPGRSELYAKDLGTFALSTGFDWFMAKHRIPYISYVLPVAGTAEHIHGGTQWVSDGCF